MGGWRKIKLFKFTERHRCAIIRISILLDIKDDFIRKSQNKQESLLRPCLQ
jgi:hypothetical protein